MTEAKQPYPAALRYTREHEWLSLQGEVGTVGITHYAQSELGDVVFVDLPEKGKSLKGGEELGTIESVKAVSEIYSPVSGEVVAVNEALRDHPERINGDPYKEGWILKLRLTSSAELGSLMDAEAYRGYVGKGGH